MVANLTRTFLRRQALHATETPTRRLLVWSGSVRPRFFSSSPVAGAAGRIGTNRWSILSVTKPLCQKVGAALMRRFVWFI